MVNQCRWEVHEGSEKLQSRLRHAKTATSKERVEMLYLIKTQGNTAQRSVVFAM
jgi:hypothetical protein